MNKKEKKRGKNKNNDTLKLLEINGSHGGAVAIAELAEERKEHSSLLASNLKFVRYIVLVGMRLNVVAAFAENINAEGP